MVCFKCLRLIGWRFWYIATQYKPPKTFQKPIEKVPPQPPKIVSTIILLSLGISPPLEKQGLFIPSKISGTGHDND